MYYFFIVNDFTIRHNVCRQIVNVQRYKLFIIEY